MQSDVGKATHILCRSFTQLLWNEIFFNIVLKFHPWNVMKNLWPVTKILVDEFMRMSFFIDNKFNYMQVHTVFVKWNNIVMIDNNFLMLWPFFWTFNFMRINGIIWKFLWHINTLLWIFFKSIYIFLLTQWGIL